jgi:flagellar biosynthetic protein FliR
VAHLLDLLPFKIEFALLFATRVLALISTAPFFGSLGPWSGYRLAFGLATTLVLLPVSGGADWTGPGFGLALIPLIGRELFVGIFMGWVLTTAFAAVQAAGELVTGEMGLNLSAMLDPMTGNRSTVVATLYQTIAGLIFVGIGAHRWVVAGLARSFERIPVGSFSLGIESPSQLVLVVTRFMEAGLSLAAPVLVAMFVVTLLLGVVSRAVPQLNILDTGYALRVGAAFGSLILLLPALRIGLESLFEVARSAYFEALPASH